MTQKLIGQDIMEQKWRCLGPTWRKEPSNIKCTGLEYSGQEGTRWTRDNLEMYKEADRKVIKMIWEEANTTPRDHQRLKAVVKTLCSAWNKEA